MPAPEPTNDPTQHTPSGRRQRAAGDTGPPGGADPTGPWTAPAAATPARVGRYEIRDTLGAGAYGRVFRAFDPELRREVAVKVPHPQGLTPEVRARFVREARAAATVQHPNVCPIYDVGADGDVPFLVMRLVPGRTLADALAGRPAPLPPAHAAAVARQVALGVAAAHAEGVVHRDLKPGNVLWDEAGRQVFVTDFGLARVGGEAALTNKGDVLGTPCYMAPEQARGDAAAVGPLSDVYSLGVILYRMLAGEPPYAGTVYEVMLRACEGNPRPPSAVRPGVDPALDRLCLKAMAVAPAARFPSARAFADALADYLRGGTDEVLDLPPDEPPPAPPPPPLPRPAPPARPPVRPAWADMDETAPPPPLTARPRPHPRPAPDRGRSRARGFVVPAAALLVGGVLVGAFLAVRSGRSDPPDDPPNDPVLVAATPTAVPTKTAPTKTVPEAVSKTVPTKPAPGPVSKTVPIKPAPAPPPVAGKRRAAPPGWVVFRPPTGTFKAYFPGPGVELPLPAGARDTPGVEVRMYSGKNDDDSLAAVVGVLTFPFTVPEGEQQKVFDAFSDGMFNKIAEGNPRAGSSTAAVDWLGGKAREVDITPRAAGAPNARFVARMALVGRAGYVAVVGNKDGRKAELVDGFFDTFEPLAK